MDLKLQNKKALVSASSSGIGFAIAYQMAREGAEVIINGRSKEKLEQAKSKILQDFPSAKIEFSISNLATLVGVEEVSSQFPEVDILINNLGVYEAKDFFDIQDEDWQRLFDVNVMSGIRLTRHYFKSMLQKKWGRVIFIASESGVNVPVDMIHYAMTKTCQLSLMAGLAKMTKGTEVTVNSVLPGPTRSDGVEVFLAQSAAKYNQDVDTFANNFMKEMRSDSLLSRFLDPMEVANLVTYVASPLSVGTNGASLRVEGGIIKSVA